MWRWLGSGMVVTTAVENDEGRIPTVELPLAAFAPADYIIELQAASGSIVARSLLAFRVR
jgi:hypothetical protein